MGVRVLIAHSSGNAREIIRHHLECMGCEVTAETETVEQTVALFRMVKPEVITLDIGLREGADFDVLSMFRMIRNESPQTTVLLVGASGATAGPQQFISEGATELLMDSFDSAGFEELFRSLAHRYPELNSFGTFASRSQSRVHRCAT
ncbi:MAG TPA: response regulator [Candidatus Binataceae bacterium]|nr:response regulator [Candidatus Binataceae bacterium]